MSTDKSITEIEVIEAPWNKTVTLQNIDYEGGMNMLRIRIKEGMRFTDLELDPGTVEHLNQSLSTWLSSNGGTPVS